MSLAQHRHHIVHTYEPRAVLKMLHVNVYTAQIPRITPSQLYNANQPLKISNAHRVFAHRVSASTLPIDRSSPNNSPCLVFRSRNSTHFVKRTLWSALGGVHGCLPLVVLRAQIVPYGRDERVQLCEECDRPHDVHGGGGEDEGRAPDTISKRQLLLQIVDGYMYVCLSVLGKACGASLMSPARRTGRAYKT